jgi:ATP-dependent Clp protease ATP-binding subunit ClpC
MATYRFPVLIWQDFQGYYTAHLVEASGPAGFGRKAADARDQVEDFLSWSFKENPWQSAPDFLEARLVEYRVPVRPEYQEADRIYPCAETFALRVPGVLGRQESGLLVCCLPTLSLRFSFYDADSLRNLVSQHVQQALRGLTPQALARCLPLGNPVLEEIVIRVAPKRTEPDDQPVLPTLAAVAEPLGDPRLRRQFSKPYERDVEVADLVRRLGQDKANVLLVGDPGCGKTTVLVEAVRLLERQPAPENEEEPPRTRPKRRYWLTSGSRLIAGMKYLGQWEERCERLIEELAGQEGVLCVESLLDLVREGGRAPTNSVAAFFLPFLQRGELRLVAEATPEQLDACRRLLPGLADLFQILALPPLSRQQAVTVLDLLAAARKQDLHLDVAPGVADLVYHLFHRFLPYHSFPGKAVAFLNDLFDLARRERRTEVTAPLVVRQFTRQTGLPELFLRDELPLEREAVLERLRQQVLGQEEACQAAANLATTFKAGLNDPRRPVGVLLFCGPTGVGKTELAKALARYFFGHGEQPDRLLRLDMSEYAGSDAAERLLTQPSGRPSELIQRVRQQPFTILLLDEIEKADPQVFDVLLGVFDEGRLSDRYGRTATFRSAVIIMTSNLGAGKQTAFGFGKEPSVLYDAEALSYFRPEFFNRIDVVVTFQPLREETILAITRKELAEIAGREGLVKSGIRLTWTDPVVVHLARKGFDARYGARPMQRALETLVVAPLAHHLLGQTPGEAKEVQIDVGPEGQIIFRGRRGEDKS